MLSLSDPPQNWKTGAKFLMGTGYTFYRIEEFQDGAIKSQKRRKSSCVFK